MRNQQMIRLEAEVRSWLQSTEFVLVRRHIDAALGMDENPEAVCDTITSLVRAHLREYLKGKRAVK